MDSIPIGMGVLAFLLLIVFAMVSQRPASKTIKYTSAINVIDGPNTTYLDYSSIIYRLNGGKQTLNLDASGNLNMLSGSISTGSITVGTLNASNVTMSSISTTGAISGGNITASGNISTTGILNASNVTIANNLTFSNTGGIYLNGSINWYMGTQKGYFDNGGNGATFRISAAGTASDLVLNASNNVALQIGGSYKFYALSDKVVAEVPIRTNAAAGAGNGILFSLPGYSPYQYAGANIYSSADAYNPTGGNALMLGSWNGIGFSDLSNGGTVRGAFSTRTGDMSISGSLTSSSISSSGVITCGSIVSGTIRSNTQIGVVNSAPWDHINISHDGSTAFFDAGGAEGGFAFRSTTSNSSYPSNIGYTERMRINGNGLVGINTASPVTYLHVYGSGDVASGILVENAQASDNASRNLLSGRFNASLAPSMSGPNLYLYASSGYTPYRCILSASTYFTGQHGNQPIETQSYLKTNVEDYIGLIVSSAGQGCYSINPMTKEVITGKKAICINEALPLIILTNKDKDKAVWGVITNVKNEAYNPDGTIDKDNNTQWGDRLDSMIRINGLGEGAVWVTNINGAIENGDLICSSIIPGYGRVQDDDLFHNYTVAKSTISCDFDLNNNDLYECVEFEHNGVIYKKAFIACTYHCS